MKNIARLFLLFCVFFAPLYASHQVCYQLGDKLYPQTKSHMFKNRRQVLSLIQSHDVQTIIEVGCWMGESTIFMAKHLPEGGKVYAIDSWIGYPREIYQITLDVYERFLSNVIHAKMTERIIPIRMTSVSASHVFAQYQEKADMVYIDGDHSYYSVYTDIVNWSAYLKEGGILCGNLFSRHDETNIIKKAVLDFCKKNRKKPFFDKNFWEIRDL